MSRVTLTFDNGPTPGVTRDVLDVLQAREVSALFFVVGERLRLPGGRRLVEQARALGHGIGNHSFTHGVPLGLRPGREAAEREIGAAEEELGPLGDARLFRPFGSGGDLDERLLSPEAVDVLCERGYSCVLWNSIPRDWDDPNGWVTTALDQVRRLDHAVVVLHDLPTGAMAHLAGFLDSLADLGHELTPELPAGVVPIRDGRIIRPLTGLVGRPTNPLSALAAEP